MDNGLKSGKDRIRRPVWRLWLEFKHGSKKLAEGEGTKRKGNGQITRDINWCSEV